MRIPCIITIENGTEVVSRRLAFCPGDCRLRFITRANLTELHDHGRLETLCLTIDFKKVPADVVCRFCGQRFDKSFLRLHQPPGKETT